MADSGSRRNLAHARKRAKLFGVKILQLIPQRLKKQRVDVDLRARTEAKGGLCHNGCGKAMTKVHGDETLADAFVLSLEERSMHGRHRSDDLGLAHVEAELATHIHKSPTLAHEEMASVIAGVDDASWHGVPSLVPQRRHALCAVVAFTLRTSRDNT